MNHLRKRVFAVCMLLAVSGRGVQKTSTPDELGEDDKPPPVSGSALLQAVTARLPAEPLRIHGTITVRKRRGTVLKSLRFHTLFDLGRIPALAQYTILDTFGRELERLTVVRRAGAQPVFTYESGDPLVAGDVPSLSEPIQETDIRWMDLTLSFLWWPGGTLLGSEETRGRPCYLVEVVNPHFQAPATGEQLPGCARVRLWIDRKLLMLIRAELIDSSGRPVRRLWIDSFKKIDDQWMIKDMEVEAEPVVHRTKLTIRDVESGRSL